MSGLTKALRPFKIHNEKTHLDLPWRSYTSAERAIERTLGLLWKLQVGNTFTVYDDRSSKAILQVTRKPTGLQFFEDNPGTLQQIIKATNGQG